MAIIIIGIVYSVVCAFIVGMLAHEKNDSKNFKDFIEENRKKMIKAIWGTAISFVIGIVVGIILKIKINTLDFSITVGTFLIGQIITWIINLGRFEKKIFNNRTIIEKIGTDFSEYKFRYDGVFAVSAIMISSDFKKFLLVKRNTPNGTNEDLWVQPGAYYRTNLVEYNNNPEKLPSFYDFIVSKIHEETGLHEADYTSIFISDLFDEGELRTPNVYINSMYSNSAAQALHENKIYQPSLFIQEEIPFGRGQKKTSNTSVHIDNFYAFKLNEAVDTEYLKGLMENTTHKYKEIDLFTIEDIRHKVTTKECYQDIEIVMSKFLELFRKDLFITKFKDNIRYCTFNPNNRTLWLRINDFCNLTCCFCLMKDRKTTEGGEIKKDLFESFLKEQIDLKENNGQKIKVVITGGEPFLIENLTDLVLILVEYDWIDTVSICTNGTQQANIESFTKMMCIKHKSEKIKFVINMSAYDINSYKDITGKDEFAKQKAVVKNLIDEGYSVTANIVMTNVLKNNLGEYFKYWIVLGVKIISFSYAIHIGIIARAETNSRALSKSDCLKLYHKIGDGNYAIENFEKIELMIPSCDEVYCQENNNIIACYVDSNGNFKRTKNNKNEDCCLDV